MILLYQPPRPATRLLKPYCVTPGDVKYTGSYVYERPDKKTLKPTARLEKVKDSSHDLVLAQVARREVLVVPPELLTELGHSGP